MVSHPRFGHSLTVLFRNLKGDLRQGEAMKNVIGKDESIWKFRKNMSVG